MPMNTRKVTLTVMVLVTLVMATPAFAYIDPASGSMLLQLVLGGIAGLLLLFKVYWHRLLSLFGLRSGMAKDDAGE